LLSDEDVERVIVKTLEGAAGDRDAVSTRSMAAATAMSQSAISRMWRAFGWSRYLAELENAVGLGVRNRAHRP
jgi:hypothetical protein